MESKIYFTSDDLEIIDYMTDSEIKHKSNDESRVFTFIRNNDYNLIMFSAAQNDKGYVLFRIKDIKDNLDQIPIIISALQDAVHRGENVLVNKKAIEDVSLMLAVGYAAELMKNSKY